MTREEFISQMGYSDNSPLKNEESLDIKTGDNGIIDMSNTGTPLMANGKYLPPYSGHHQFEPNSTVTEIPLQEYKHHGEVIKWARNLFRPPSIPSAVPLSNYSTLRLGEGYKDLFNVNLPERFQTTPRNMSMYDKDALGLSDFNKYRKVSFADWEKKIKQVNDFGLIGDNPLQLKSFNNLSLSVNKNNEISAQTLQNVINSIKTPHDKHILQQTLNEYTLNSNVTDATEQRAAFIAPVDGSQIMLKNDIPDIIGADKRIGIEQITLSGQEPKINLDMFKQSVTEKIIPLKHTLTPEWATQGLDRLHIKRENLLENQTIMLHTEDLGPTIASGKGQNISPVDHFGRKDVFGHLRYYVEKDRPQTRFYLEGQSDEMQQYHKVGKTIKGLEWQNLKYERLMKGEHESIAVDQFNMMWTQAESPQGFLGYVGGTTGLETGSNTRQAITRNSQFPLVTNIPSGIAYNPDGSVMDSTPYNWGVHDDFWKNPYKKAFVYKDWDKAAPYANKTDHPLIFNNYDEVLKFRTNFINANVVTNGGITADAGAVLRAQNVTPDQKEWDDVMKSVFTDEIAENNQKIKDLTTSISTDPTVVDSEQLMRNLQKKKLQKTQRQRVFYEALVSAAQNGFTEVAWPTAETAAKIQGYPGATVEKLIQNPWTHLKEEDFLKELFRMTSVSGNDVTRINKYGPFIHVPHLPEGRNYGSHDNTLNNTLPYTEKRWETGIERQDPNGNAGFEDREVTIDRPPNITAGFYHVLPNGSWERINHSLLEGNTNVVPSKDLHWAPEFSGAVQSYDINDPTQGTYKHNSAIQKILDIRNEHYIELRDPNEFRLSDYSSEHQTILKNSYMDFEEMLRMEPSLGANYPYETITRGTKWRPGSLDVTHPNINHEKSYKGHTFNVIKLSEDWLRGKVKRELKFGGELPKYQDKGEVTEQSINFKDVEKGIRGVESLNGVLMKNKQSSASGFYGDLFDNLDYDGTRDEFIADTNYQEELFRKRYNGELEDIPGLESNGLELYAEYKDQFTLQLTPTEIAALSNMLGRQGTRNYLGRVLRDGESLETVFPKLYGDKRQLGKDGKPLENKKPDIYIEEFNNALIEKKMGGSIGRLEPSMTKEVIGDMLENGAFLPKFKRGSEMNIEGSLGEYNIKKDYDEEHRLPYIQFNQPNGEVENNKVYYDQDDINGDDNFNIIDIDSQTMHQDREHERIKTIIIKRRGGEILSNLEKEYLNDLGLLENKIEQDRDLSAVAPTHKGIELSIKDINTKKHLYNKSNGNNDGISLNRQVEIYDAHINNLFNVDSVKAMAKSIYNKLNTLYYNDAKASKMSVFDYMKSLNN